MSKFNKKQKLEIYRKWKDEKISISQLSKAYKINLAFLDYMLRLIDMHGINVLDRSYQVYSKEFKEKAIEQAIFGTKPYMQLTGCKTIADVKNAKTEENQYGLDTMPSNTDPSRMGHYPKTEENQLKMNNQTDAVSGASKH